MFWRLAVKSPSNQEICQASLEGGYFKKENWYYRKGALVIEDTWVLFGVSIKILESVDKLLGARSTGMQGKEESKGGESASLSSPSFESRGRDSS